MSTPSKRLNLDSLGYAKVTEAGVGFTGAQVEWESTGAIQISRLLTNRNTLYLKVMEGSGRVYIGWDDGVDDTNGFGLDEFEELWLTLGPDIEVWGYAEEGARVCVCETSAGAPGTAPKGQGGPSKVINIDTLGYMLATEAGSSVKQASILVDGTENEDKVELTAGLANRRWLIVKFEGPIDVTTRFIFIGGEDIELGNGPPVTAKGLPVWARFEVVLPATPGVPIYALMSATGDGIPVRVMEIG